MIKYIGQHIFDFIARFRQDVRFEGAIKSKETSSINLESDHSFFLQMNSDLSSSTTRFRVGNKAASFSDNQPFLNYAGETGELNLNIYDDPSTVGLNTGLSIINYVDSANPAEIQLSNRRAIFSAGQDGDEIGRIKFISNNAPASGFVGPITYADIFTKIEEATATDEAGTMNLRVAASDGSTSALQNALLARGEGTANTVSVDLGYGAGSETTTAGNLTVTGGTALIKAADSSTSGRILIREASSNGTNYVGFYAPASIGTSQAYQLPAADGNANDFLQTNGSGVLTWAAGGGGASSVNVSSGSQAAVGMQVARRTITTGEANSMHSTPIEIVPAQGANTIIMPVSGRVRVDRAATQTNAAADFNMHYEGLEPGTFFSTSLMHIRRFMWNETGDRELNPIGPGGDVAQSLTQSVNKAVEMSFDSATTTNCFTSIDVFLIYYVIDIS